MLFYGYLFTFVCVVIILVYIHFSIKYARIIKCLKNLTGPPPIPFVGNGWSVRNPQQFLNLMINCAQEYGTIFKARLGPFRYIAFISDEQLMEKIFSSSVNIKKSREYTFMENWLGTGLLTSSGLKWKQRRRILTPAFHFSVLEQFVHVFENAGKTLINKLEKQVGKDSVDIHPLISLCTLDIICEAAMRTSVNAQENEECEYVKSVKEISKIIISRTFSLVKTLDILYQFTFEFYREKRALRVLHGYTNKVIDQRVKELENSKNENVEENGNKISKNRPAFLDLLLQCTIDGKPLTRADLREEVDTFMFEGHDTTASAISFTLYELARHPDIQDKAIEEQQQIFGHDRNTPVTHRELHEMKYLELVIKEALRLYPSVPFISRQLTDDVPYDGGILPEGLTCLLLPFYSQRNPDYFSEPNKFIPERFETRHGNNPYVYVPFSAGPRNCIGQKFAMLEMKNIISKILRNFILLPAKSNSIPELSAELVLISLNGINISLEKRNW